MESHRKIRNIGKIRSKMLKKNIVCLKNEFNNPLFQAIRQHKFQVQESLNAQTGVKTGVKLESFESPSFVLFRNSQYGT